MIASKPITDNVYVPVRIGLHLQIEILAFQIFRQQRRRLDEDGTRRIRNLLGAYLDNAVVQVENNGEGQIAVGAILRPQSSKPSLRSHR